MTYLSVGLLLRLLHRFKNIVIIQSTFLVDSCPAGQLNNIGSLTCENCGYGFYQGLPDQVVCYPCDSGLTTTALDARNISECTSRSLLIFYYYGEHTLISASEM